MKGEMMKAGQRVRLVRDACGDLPKSLIGRCGRLISRDKLYDEMGVRAWRILFDGRMSDRVVWEDELKAA